MVRQEFTSQGIEREYLPPCAVPYLGVPFLQVLEQSSAIVELLDADPSVLENRLSVLLRIEGAVETPQKLDFILSSMESRAGGDKGLELSINRMAEP